MPCAGVWCAFLISLAVVTPHRLFAQFDTRAEQIQAARRQKAQVAVPETLSRGERTLQMLRDKKVLERISAGVAGFRVKFGGLVSGSGFAIGPEYLRRDLAGGNLIFRTAVQSSFRAYRRYDVQLSAPGIAGNTLFANFFAVRHNYPGINYYGPGPDSLKASRTNYRFEDSSLDLDGGVRPFRRLRLGASAGYLWVNVGPGGDYRFASTEQVFSPDEAPGLDRQTDFARYGGYATFDYRDDLDAPRSGGYYTVRYNHYIDQNLGAYSFNRVDMDFRQLIPLFNKRRVIALRAKAVLTDPTGNNRVPFYLQPTLGGADTLRGYREFRFRDSNVLVVNAEWRWEVFSGLDMALFADGGKVFERRSQLNFHDLKHSTGFGFRFNARNRVFFRVDVGFSEEATQVWFKFDNIFLSQRFRSSPYP